jgi:hypothetical protein
MKTSGALILLVMFFISSGCSHLRPSKTDAAVVEFERQEDNGFVNLVPCKIVLSDGQKLSLSGGERAVVSVQPGNLWVTVFSQDPYSPHSSARAWRSSRTALQIERGQKLRVFVEPMAKDSAYIGGWKVRATNGALQATSVGPGS